MFAIVPILVRGVVTLAFSGAAVISSIGFLNRSKQQPQTTTNSLSPYELGKLAVLGLGVFLGYKVLREVFE